MPKTLNSFDIAEALEADPVDVRRILAALSRDKKIQRERRKGDNHRWLYLYDESAVQMVKEVMERPRDGSNKISNLVREFGGNGALEELERRRRQRLADHSTGLVIEPAPQASCCGQINGLIGGKCFRCHLGLPKRKV